MADILGNIVSGIFGIGGQAQQFAHQSALQQQQNEFNLQMWKMNNEYNSPQAQMQRFKDAGLNPNLIYGQGSNGNSSSPPVMGTPQAPNYSRSMEKLAQAFNIEGLRTQIAERKKAEADAISASVDAQNKKDQRSAQEDFGILYSFDPAKGSYVFNNPDSVVFADANRKQKALKAFTGAFSNRSYYFNKNLENNYVRTHLIPYRAALLDYQKKYLVPQVAMAEYENEYFPWSFWIDRGAKAAHAVGDVVDIFNPTNWITPTKFNRPPMQYQQPTKRVTTYY